MHLTGGGLDVLICLELVEPMRGHAPAVVLKEALEGIRIRRDEQMQEWKRWHP
ncbi:Uncharacterized protein ABJ99_3576 [Pseudomonas syringae pv. cilantro]|uniref:Uncharacterized protein n=1 Tax=Pseudomonas syringae pv. cilantro TaxID=81035 RepID=A0A0N0XE79_PSESX|nr:Uncharacterized protein ABJ99_3576 [Pseudomonas syringae pv. cilantro]